VAPSKNQEREAREARERLKRYNARQAVHTHQTKRRVRDNIIAAVAAVIVVAAAAAVQISFFTVGPGTPTPEPSASASATPSAAPEANVGDVPDPSVAEAREWTGELTLNSTKLGFTLDGVGSPQAVASFVQDAKDGYFIDKTCHRLVDNASAGLIQCGSLDGIGGSDPDYSYGPVEAYPEDGIYEVGTIAVARIQDQGYSEGHQFFIVFGEATLPADTAGGYTVIGKVTSGIDGLVTDIVDGGLTESVADSGDGTPNVATTIAALTVK